MVNAGLSGEQGCSSLTTPTPKARSQMTVYFSTYPKNQATECLHSRVATANG